VKRLRGCLGVFLIFFFGIVVGVALTNGAIWKEIHDLIEGGPDVVVAKISDRLDKELKLDDAQKRMLAEIVTETRIKLRVARADAQPKVEEALAEAQKRTRAILTSGQQRKFDEIVKRAGEKWLAPVADAAPGNSEKLESAVPKKEPESADPDKN
jgi:hypothetical protein